MEQLLWLCVVLAYLGAVTWSMLKWIGDSRLRDPLITYDDWMVRRKALLGLKRRDLVVLSLGTLSFVVAAISTGKPQYAAIAAAVIAPGTAGVLLWFKRSTFVMIARRLKPR